VSPFFGGTIKEVFIMEKWMILLIIPLLISSIGFKSYVWFFSIGYAFSVTGLVLAIGIMHYSELTLLSIMMIAVMCIYSLRLGIFLTRREFGNKNYKKVLDEAADEIAGKKQLPIFVAVIVWIFVVGLYYAQVAPLFYRMTNGLSKKDPVIFIIGIAIAVIGVLLQTKADSQKDAAKKINPKRFCDTGLYKMVRCPNYFGEILVWTGMVVGSITCLQGAGQITIAILGYVGLVYVMFNGARRLEKRQNASYGEDPEYQAYVKKVPILIPLVPIYSVENAKFLG
jgi:steroid 5-alpha reductase family enzyme